MNTITIFILKCLRHSYLKLFQSFNTDPIPVMEREEGNNLIYQVLSKGEPCMIARYGATELTCIHNYLSIQKHDKNFWKYIKGETNDWWWNPRIKWHMEWSSGFFPTTDDNLSRFSEMMLEDSRYVDVLAVFSNNDSYFIDLSHILSYLKEGVQYVPLISFDSYLCESPWTRYLKGKRVLVIHPYAKLIEKQYLKRNVLFDNCDVLPDFKLRTVEAVQSLGGVNHGHDNWFDALRWMKKEMDKEPYDVCLIGCGAYGFPLAAHSKRTGHQAIHIGGPLQLLFGIKGGRWERSVYASSFRLPEDTYVKLMDNPNWVRPSEYKSMELEQMEDSAYL